MCKRIHIGLFMALLFIPLPEIFAKEVQTIAIENLSFVVGTVASINKKTRVLSFMDKNAEEFKFTLSQEVKNIDKIKSGDKVMVQYLNAFATDLGRTGYPATGQGSQDEIKPVKQFEPPMASVTRTRGTVLVVDQKNNLLTVKGPEQNIVVNVSGDYDLSQIIAGEKVDVSYIEYYAINIMPASEIAGTVTVKSTSIALGLGYEWGRGEMTMYDDSRYVFDIEGISFIDLGVSLLEAEGTVYRVLEPEDLEGKYWVAEIGSSYGKGSSAVMMKNNKGVILYLTSKLKGMKATLAAERLKIKNITPVN